MMFDLLLVLLISIQASFADTLHNIFQSLSITNPSTLSRPQDIRTATLVWELKVGSALPNDIFRFHLPYVFRTKFEGSQLFLKADNITYATCNTHDGSFNNYVSYLECTVTNAIDTDKDITASGEVSFDFVFNAGASTLDSDIASANHWVAGENEVSWSGLSTTVDFEGGSFFAPNSNDVNNLIFYSRSTPQNYEQIYVLSGACNYGISSGKLSITTNGTFDCSKFHLKSTNNLNDFYLPKNYSSVASGSISCSSDKKSLIANFNNIPEGYRVFIEGLEIYPSNFGYVKHSYTSELSCGDGSTKKDALGRIIKVIDGNSTSIGNLHEVVTTTHTWTGSYTRSTTLPCLAGAITETIVVEVPDTDLITTKTTTTKPRSENYSSTTILPYISGDSVITVEVETPAVNRIPSFSSSSLNTSETINSMEESYYDDKTTTIIIGSATVTMTCLTCGNSPSIESAPPTSSLVVITSSLDGLISKSSATIIDSVVTQTGSSNSTSISLVSSLNSTSSSSSKIRLSSLEQTSAFENRNSFTTSSVETVQSTTKSYQYFTYTTPSSFTIDYSEPGTSKDLTCEICAASNAISENPILGSSSFLVSAQTTTVPAISMETFVLSSAATDDSNKGTRQPTTITSTLQYNSTSVDTPITTTLSALTSVQRSSSTSSNFSDSSGSLQIELSSSTITDTSTFTSSYANTLVNIPLLSLRPYEGESSHVDVDFYYSIVFTIMCLIL